MEYSSVQPLDGDMFAARLCAEVNNLIYIYNLYSNGSETGAEMCVGQFEELQLPHVMGVEGVGVVLKSASENVPEGARLDGDFLLVLEHYEASQFP